MVSHLARNTSAAGLGTILSLGSQLVLPWEPKQFLRWVKVSFVAAFRGIGMATDWNRIWSCYNIEQYDTSLHVVIQMKANKLFLDVIALFFRFIQFLGGQTIFNISSTQPFYYKEVVELITFDHFSSRASTCRQNVFTQTALSKSVPWSTGERSHADVWGNRLPFPSKPKNNFSGIDISQPTPSMSLSVPSFSLGANHWRVSWP